MLATLTSKGQVTVPKEIREALKLDAGAKLDFTLQPDGTFVARPMKNSFRDIIGLLKRPADGQRFSIAEEREAVGRALSEDDDRIRREAALPPASRTRNKRAP